MEKNNQELQSVSTQTSTSDKQTCEILGNGRFCYQITRPFENQIKIEKHFFCLPSEILCQIISYLDEKSIRSVLFTCKQLFHLVRGNGRFSGHVTLNSIDLKNLLEKIESAEWNWERWSCLKTLKIPLKCKNSIYFGRGSPAEKPFDLLKLMKFELCQSLQRVVIFNCDLPLHAYTRYGKTIARYGNARVLYINPRSVPTEFSFEFVNFLSVEDLRYIDSQTLREIGENATQLQKLTIRLENEPFLEKHLENGLIPMLKGLSRSLRNVCFDISYHFCREYGLILDRILKALSENCVNLEIFRIKGFTPYIIELRISELDNCFQKLRQLIVPKFQHVYALISDSNNLTNLVVEQVMVNEFDDEFDNLLFDQFFSKLCHLKTCEIHVISQKSFGHLIHKWVQLVDNNFREETKVVVRWIHHEDYPPVLTKLPYEKTSSNFLFYHENFMQGLH